MQPNPDYHCLNLYNVITTEHSWFMSGPCLFCQNKHILTFVSTNLWPTNLSHLMISKSLHCANASELSGHGSLCLERWAGTVTPGGIQAAVWLSANRLGEASLCTFVLWMSVCKDGKICASVCISLGNGSDSFPPANLAYWLGSLLLCYWSLDW